MEEIRWGIIGCGDVCEVKSGPAFYKCTGSRLVSVMRRDAGKAKDFARRHSVAKWFDDAQKLIDDPEVNAVYIATPPGSHCDYALRVCVAGKTCYVEKPMARNSSECRRMVEAFAAARIPLFVAYYRRGMDRFLKAKELIDAGALGKVTGVTYRMYRQSHRREFGWRLNPIESGGGLFLDVGSHTLDIIDYLLGPLEYVSGVARNASGKGVVEDCVAMSFTINGIAGSATWNFATDAFDDMIEIHGADAVLHLSTFENEPVRLTRGDSAQEFPFPRPEHVHQGLVQMIVDELRGRGKSPSTGITGARTSAVMDQVLSSYYGGREDGFWDRARHRATLNSTKF
jgi:1,5-anhydro-D-fructose reductase (1,5-anhydro-D-mannitol-forming)